MRNFFLTLASALVLAGCETLSYYAQAIGGHMELAGRARPVDALLEDPATGPELRARLALAQRAREFASRELRLPDNASYRSYADLGRPYAVWNVVAAPEFALEPVQSCFPVAGCVSYRGFFAQEDAARHAARLTREGLDVFVYGVPAYSTLGVFADPLLSTFIAWPEAALARLLFHELAHQLVYVRDDSTFNESFAVAVEREGLRRWLGAQGRLAELERYERAKEAERRFTQRLEETRARLREIYRSSRDPEAKRAAKRAELEKLGSDSTFLRHMSRFGQVESDPNNALLASFATYARLVPEFERLLAASGGDLETFYASVKSLAALNKAERERKLQESGTSTTLR
jgi:predicted aminopeptidase